MQKNIGSIDRSIRALAGIIAIALYALSVVQGTAGIIALVIGIVLLGTSLVSWCPPYTLLGINTRGKH